MMSKIENLLGLVADLAPGALAVLGGLSLIVGGSTGVLW
jgi:hypothetical protein